MKIPPKTLKKVPMFVALLTLASLPFQSLIANFTKNDITNQANAFEALTISPNEGPTAGGTDVTISGLGFDETVDIVQVAGGFSHSLALDSDGKVYSWGRDNYGQLGNGATTGNQASPVAVDISGVLSGKTITAIAADYNHSLALDSDGQFYSWGRDHSGQLGDGGAINSTDFQASPVAVDTSDVLNGKTITAIAAGSEFSLALDSDGQLYSWGRDDYGQLGDGGTNTNQASPVAVDTNPATSALAYIPGPISVTFDPAGTAAECANIVLVDENTITCTTSAHVAGTVDVLVGDTVRTSTLQQGFTYTAEPEVPVTPEVPDTGAK